MSYTHRRRDKHGQVPSPVDVPALAQSHGNEAFTLYISYTPCVRRKLIDAVPSTGNCQSPVDVPALAENLAN